MAEYDRIMTALRAADKAGDTEAAQRLAQMAVEARAQAFTARNPDGTFGQPPEGAMIDPATGQMIIPELQQAAQERVVQAYPVAGRAQEFVQGAPFVGEYFDESLGLVSPEAAERSRMVSEAFEAQRPGQSAALNIAGGITATLPAAAAGTATQAGQFIGRGGTALSRGLRAGAIAAPTAAAEGAASFAGRADPGERAGAAATGAVVGGTLGAALGPVATLVGEGAGALAKRVKSLDVVAIADEFGISPAAARTVRSALKNDDLDAAQARIAQLGDDAFLADAGPATAALLDAAANTGGKALRVAREAVGGRASKVGKQLPKTLDRILGKPIGTDTAARKVARETQRSRQKAYAVAYSRPINYADKTGRDIEDALARIPPKTLQSAISEANDAMRSIGATNQQILAELAEDGSVSFRELPNVQQLDEIKKALDVIGRENVDQFGRPTSQGVRAKRLARQLREAVKEAVPEYSRALRVAGGKLQEDEALDLGRKIFFKNTSVEDVKAFLKDDVSHQARRGLRTGMREAIEQNLSNVRRTISDPNVDAREAMQLVKEMSSRANINKVELAIGKKRAQILMRELNKSASALELRAAIAQNSKTAIRQGIQEQVVEEATPGLARRVAGRGGNPFEAAQEITETLAGIDPRTMSGQQKAILDEIAQALVGKRGFEAQQALTSVNRALRGQPIKDAEAQLIGRVVGGSLATGGYRAGARPLEQQSQR